MWTDMGVAIEKQEKCYTFLQMSTSWLHFHGCLYIFEDTELFK